MSEIHSQCLTFPPEERPKLENLILDFSRVRSRNFRIEVRNTIHSAIALLGLLLYLPVGSSSIISALQLVDSFP